MSAYETISLMVMFSMFVVFGYCHNKGSKRDKKIITLHAMQCDYK